MSEKFQNLVVLPKNVYLEMKREFEYEQKLSELDKKIKKILQKKDISDFDKWNLYNEELLNYANINKIIQKNNDKNVIQQNQQQQKPKTSEKEIQTKFVPSIKSITQEQNTDSSYLHLGASDIINNVDKAEINPTPKNNHSKNNILLNFTPQKEELFSNSMDSFNIQELMQEKTVNDFEEMEVDNEDLEMELFDEAVKQLGPERQSDVVKNRNSMGRSFREFVDRNTGATVHIDVNDARKKLYNAMNQEQTNNLATPLHQSTPSKLKKKQTKSLKTVKPQQQKKDILNNTSPKIPRRTKRQLSPKEYKTDNRKTLKNYVSKIKKKKLESAKFKPNKNLTSDLVWSKYNGE